MARDSAKIEVGGLAVLAFVIMVVLRRPLPNRAIDRIYGTTAVPR